MNSLVWLNGPHQQLGPSSKSSQAAPLTQDTKRNQQAGTNDSCQYNIMNMAVPPPQPAHFTPLDRQMSNWQTSAAPHQPDSSQQTSGGKRSSYLEDLLSNCHNSTNMQSGNLCLLGANRLQVATKHNLYQNSAQNSKPQSSANIMTTGPEQDITAHRNQLVKVHWKPSIRTQDRNVSDLHLHRVQNRLHQNVIGKRIKPYPAALLLREHSSTARNRQTAPNQNHRQNVIQHGFSPSILPPSYSTAVTQSFMNNSITTKLSSTGQIWHTSSMSHEPQQYSVQLKSLGNNGGEATSSIDPSSNSYQYETSCFLQQTNERPLDPANDIRQQMPSSTAAQEIARIADSLRNSYSDPMHTNSPYKGKQFVGEVRGKECNQTMQPLISAQSYNSNSPKLLPLQSGQTLPHQGIAPRKHHIVNAPPHQSTLPFDFFATTTGDGIGHGRKAGGSLFPEHSSVSPQRTEAQQSAVNSLEVLEIFDLLSLAKQSNSSIHPSPGCTGTRAVAVVQPLSQERYQGVNKDTFSNTTNRSSECIATDKSLRNPQKLFISLPVAKNSQAANMRQGFNISPESPTQMRTSKHVIARSASSSDGTVVSSSSESPGKVCADVKGSELATKMQVYQHVTPAAQQSVSSEVSQNNNMDKPATPTDPKASVFDLSSIPTTPWTMAMLRKLILDDEAQMKVEDLIHQKFQSENNIINMFWGGQSNLLCKLKSGWYKDLIADIKEFCSKHIALNCVVLSQVEKSSEMQLKSCHLLKDNEVYSEPPYRSTWWNVNKQVDDIDKEFGFPWSLMRRHYVLESLSPLDQVGTVNSVPAQIANEVPSKVLSQTEPEPVDPGEENQASTAEVLSTQTSSPIRSESDNSSDSLYSFEIQVLPPEEAKIIFEQTQSKIPQSTTDLTEDDEKPDSHSDKPESISHGKVVDSSMEAEVAFRDVTLMDSKLETEVVPSIEQICCIDRWREKFVWSSLSNCQCKEEKRDKGCTDRAAEKEKMMGPKHNKLRAISSEGKCHSPVKGQDQAKVRENIGNPALMYSWPDVSTELSPTTDLTEDDGKPDSHSDKEPKSISHISVNNSIILRRESENEDLSSSEIPSQIPDFGDLMLDPEEERVQDCLNNSDKEIQMVLSREAVSHVLDPEEDRARAWLTSTHVAETSVETQKQIKTNVVAALKTTFSLSHKHETAKRKRKTLSSNERIPPTVKKLEKSRLSVSLNAQPVCKGIKCKQGYVNAAGSEDVKTVELTLFGFSRQENCSTHTQVLAPDSSSDAVEKAPCVLSLTLNTSRTKSSVPTPECSVKRCIHEKWKSYAANKLRHRRKLTPNKCSFAFLSGVNLKKVETAVTTNTKGLPGVSKRRNCWSLKRRKSFRHGEEKRMKHAVTVERRDRERRDADNGRHAAISLEQNNVLTFSVLPNTFDFVDKSSGRKETTDPNSNDANFVEREEKNSKTISTRGTWNPDPEMKHCPLRTPSVPNTSILFQEFQKKYMEKKQPPTAKKHHKQT